MALALPDRGAIAELLAKRLAKAIRFKGLQFGDDVMSAGQIIRARRRIVIADHVRHKLSLKSFDEGATIDWSGVAGFMQLSPIDSILEHGAKQETEIDQLHSFAQNYATMGRATSDGPFLAIAESPLHAAVYWEAL